MNNTLTEIFKQFKILFATHIEKILPLSAW